MNTSSRFRSLAERSGSDAAPPTEAAPPTGGARERFLVGTSSATIALASGTSDQPFVRCARCHADSHRDLAECSICGATFDSDEQRRFNAELAPKLADERRAAREEREARSEDVERRRRADFDARQEREMKRIEGESARAEIGELLRRRKPSIGLVLLRLIPNPWLRMIVLIGIFAWLYRLWADPATNGIAGFASFVVGLVFMPRFQLRRGAWD